MSTVGQLESTCVDNFFVQVVIPYGSVVSFYERLRDIFMSELSSCTALGACVYLVEINAMPRGLAIALCHRVVSLVSVTCAACIVIMMKWCCVHCDASLNRCRHTLSGVQLLFSVTTFFLENMEMLGNLTAVTGK